MTTTRTCLGIILLISVVTTVSCEPTPGPAGGTPTPVSYRSLILETVMTNRTVRPQNPDGTFPALLAVLTSPIPTPYAEVRFQADQFFVYTVTANGRDVPSGQKINGHNWFTLRDVPLSSGMRKRFQVIHVDFPIDMELAPKITLSITAIVSNGLAPSLSVVLVSTVYKGPLRPTDVFIQGTENTKPAMTDAIVTSNVVVAGWLVPPPELFLRGGAQGLPANESEDIHYTIFLDNDFLVRNYLVGNIVLEPLASAVMKGNKAVFNAVANPPQIPLIQNGGVNAGAFTLPAFEALNVELNAWHIAARGPIPAGWQADSDPAFNGNAFPWNAFAPWAGHVLQAGDYVILSGNLWQDTAHIKGCTNDPGCPIRTCWENAVFGYGGWLEMHPPNSVRFVDPLGLPQPGDPPTRKDTNQLALCDPISSTYNTFISPRTQAPDSTAVLRFETQVDGRSSQDGQYRFSDPAATHSEVIEPTCQSQLHVKAAVGPGKTFKVVYILWWEPGTIPRKDQCPKAPQHANPVVGTVDS